MRRLFSKLSSSEYVEPPGPLAQTWARISAIGPVAIVLCVLSTVGLLVGTFTGVTIIPGKSTVHLITFEDSPIWFLIAMLFNAIVAFFSAGYFWFRVLEK